MFLFRYCTVSIISNVTDNINNIAAVYRALPFNFINPDQPPVYTKSLAVY